MAAKAASCATEYQARSKPSISEVQEGHGLSQFGPEHPGVEQERRLVGEQLRESHALPDLAVVGPMKDVVLLQLPAGRQPAALLRHGIHLLDKLLLVLEQGLARLAILL